MSRQVITKIVAPIWKRCPQVSKILILINKVEIIAYIQVAYTKEGSFINKLVVCV